LLRWWIQMRWVYRREDPDRYRGGGLYLEDPTILHMKISISPLLVVGAGIAQHVSTSPIRIIVTEACIRDTLPPTPKKSLRSLLAP